MKQSSLLIIGLVLAFVLLGCIGVLVLAFFPYEDTFGPTPTLTATSTITPSATFPIFLPTASSVTPTSEPPTPVNTLLPTITPRSTHTPFPTGALPVVTIVVPPTPTPTISVTLTLTPTATVAPRYYTLSFETSKTEIDLGDCVNLTWQSTGPVNLSLEDKPVASSGKLRVCPRNDTTYTMTYKVAGTAQVQTEKILVKVNK